MCIAHFSKMICKEFHTILQKCSRLLTLYPTKYYLLLLLTKQHLLFYLFFIYKSLNPGWRFLFIYLFKDWFFICLVFFVSKIQPLNDPDPKMITGTVLKIFIFQYFSLTQENLDPYWKDHPNVVRQTHLYKQCLRLTVSSRCNQQKHNTL